MVSQLQPPTGDRGGGTRVPLLIALMVVAALLVAYWGYVRKRTDYFVQRNLRILSSFAGQLDGAFAAQETFVRNYARASFWERSAREKLLPGFESAECESEAFTGASLATSEQLSAELRHQPRQEVTRRTTRERNGVPWLEVAWAGFIPEHAARSGSCLADFRTASAASETVKVPAARCRSIRFSRVLGPLLNRERFGAFDAVFLADSAGHVLYSVTPPHAPSTLLWPSLRDRESLHPGAVVSSKVVLTELGSMQEFSGFLGRERTAVSPPKLRESTRRLDVEIGGEPYVVFTHPYAFGAPGAADRGGDSKNAWVVGGIIARERFQSDVRAISASKAALVIALCVLGICAWPFLRISLMAERQPLTITDVALLGICSVVAVMLLTLTLLDWLAYQRFSDQTDNQLRRFAYKLERDYSRNVIDALRALDSIRAWSLYHPWLDDESNLMARQAGAKQDDAAGLFVGPGGHPTALSAYPYLDGFAWIDRNGMQQFKATMGSRMPLVDVSERQYFQDALARRTWDAQPHRDGAERRPYALEWVQSLTTGETEAVLAKNSGLPDLPVLALTTQLIDVSEAVTPPGVSFAVIDEQGNVVYHPDEQRIGREDFFAETDFNRELRGAVLSRSDAYVAGSYWGEDQRLFVHPLANTQWTLVAFRGKRLVRAINIEALLLTAIALMLNAIPYLLLVTIVLAIAPWYRAPSIWPDPNRGSDYGRLVTVLSLAAGTFALSIYAITPLDLAPIVLILPVQAMLSGYVLLHRTDRRRLSLAALGVWVMATLGLVYSIAVANIDADLLVSAKPARMRLLLIAVVLFESVVALKMMTSRRTRGAVAASASLEQLVAWIFMTGVMAYLAWQIHLPEAWWASWLRLMFVLLVVLASAVLLQKTILSAHAADLRKRFCRGARALVEPRRQRMLLNALAMTIGVALIWFAVDPPAARTLTVIALMQLAITSYWMSGSVGHPRGRQAPKRWRRRPWRRWAPLRLARFRWPRGTRARFHLWRQSRPRWHVPEVKPWLAWSASQLIAFRLIWGAVTLLLVVTVAVQTSWPSRDRNWAESSVPIVFFLVVFLSMVLADGRLALARGHKMRRMLRPVSYPTSYRLAGVLTLMVGAALPTLAYFKVGSRIEQEALVKYAQLRLATAIERRINHIGAMVCRGDNGATRTCLPDAATKTARDHALSYRLSGMWDTVWTHERKPYELPREVDRRSKAHEVLANFIPQYSEDSVAMRQLHAKASSDPLWQWIPDGRVLILDRRVRFEAGAFGAFWPKDPMRQDWLRLTSYVPLLFPSTMSLGNTRYDVASPLPVLPSMAASLPSGSVVGYTVFCALLLAGLIGALFWVVRFVTERVLLLSVQDPLWIQTDRGASMGEHVFLTRRGTPLNQVLGAEQPEIAMQISFADLDRNSSWDRSLLLIDAATAQNVRVTDFEYGIDDPKMNLRKLTWLERLVRRPDRTVLVVSAVTPSYVLGLSTSPKLAERWKAMLGAFVWLTWDDVEFRRGERARLATTRYVVPNDEWTFKALIETIRHWQARLDADRKQAAEQWLKEETAHSLVLRRLSVQLEGSYDREQILDELRERAGTHYAALWMTCTMDEKLLLFHLARHGFVQSKNRHTLRRLIARGLVRRGPNLELLSETFRLYVLSAGGAEDLAAIAGRIEREGPWRALRVPIFIVITSFLLLLFATQKDLLTLTTGFAAALTTGLPVLVNFFGLFTQRRLEMTTKTR